MSKLDSEFTVEVVEVVEVLKHNNADKLEIIKFKFADGTVPEYQVVASKGDYKPGSWGVYISNDVLVPVDRPEFSFLTKRLDYIKGATTYRVKAAKIRGELSTGMLVHVNDVTGCGRDTLVVGQDMAEKMGVIRYVRPEDVEREPAENAGTNRRTGNWLAKWWRGWTRRQSINIPDYSVLSLRKSPKLFSEEELVYVTEKIHGSNIRFGRVAGVPLVGSHHTIKTDNRPRWKKLIWKQRSGNGSWYGKDVFKEWFFRVFPNRRDWDELPNNVVFYGELYGPGIQKLTYSRESKTAVVVFDAWFVKEKRWATKEELDDMLPFNLSRPPQLWYGTVTLDKIKSLAEGPSVLGNGKHIREGVVVRSADWSRRGKWVGEGYYLIKE